MFSLVKSFFSSIEQECYFTPSEALKTKWLDKILENFSRCMSEEALLQQVLVDGHFVETQNRLLNFGDFKNYSFDEILLDCLQKRHRFKFRACNEARVNVNFYRLNLPSEFTEELSEVERYKISLAVYYSLINCSYGRYYDEHLIECNMEEAVKLLQDKRAFEKSIFKLIKTDFFVTIEGYVMV